MNVQVLTQRRLSPTASGGARGVWGAIAPGRQREGRLKRVRGKNFFWMEPVKGGNRGVVT
jgi:hypothetical protein